MFETNVYSDLRFPSSPVNRPYTFINMVTTIDGKILSGGRDDSVLDLGSKSDHLLMKRIEQSADAILIGAQTLRASPQNWNPAPNTRFVVSASGLVPYEAKFFTGGRSFVVCPGTSDVQPPIGIGLIQNSKEEVDFGNLFDHIRNDLGVNRLLVSGGSELNAQLLSMNLVDELFLTIAPKVKLGRDVPTYADGEALCRMAMQNYQLVEHHIIGDEVFLRYRRDGSPA